MTRRARILALGALLAAPVLWAGPPALGAAPEVTNVVAVQREGAFIVDIAYDLVDADGDSVWVSLLFSLDGGASFPVLCENVSGDVGPGVTPGSGKHIVWHARRDVPGLELAAAVVRVRADDAPYPTIAAWYRLSDGGTLVPFAAGDSPGPLVP